MKHACLFFFFLVTSSLHPQSADPPAAGDGSSSNPYQIATFNNLYWISDDERRWGHHYIQTAHIDASVTDIVNWRPIGDRTNSFTGSYNGQGYRINELYAVYTTRMDVGLFGHIDGAVIRNVALTNVTIEAGWSVGGIAGTAFQSIISNCMVTGSIVGGDAMVGGIAGAVGADSRVINCYSTANTEAGDNVGGLVGNLANAEISNCYSTGSVYAYFGDPIGGLVGKKSNGTVNNSFWDIQTSGQSTSWGGTGKTSEEMKSYATFWDAGWDFENESLNGNSEHWRIHSNANDGYPTLSWQGYSHQPFDGDGTSANPYRISTLAELEYVSENSNIWNDAFIQTHDIDASATSGWFSSQGFIPIGNSTTPFTGLYNGQGFSLTGLTVDRPAEDKIGLFGSSSGTIENLKLNQLDITGNQYVGGAVGQNTGNINNTHAKGSVSGAGFAGLLVGENGGSTGSVVDCSSSGTVSVTGGNAGGLAGWNNGSLNQSFSTSTVSGASYAGGLTGYNVGTVSDCYTMGSISGTVEFVGGLIGRNQGTIQTCYSTSSVSGSIATIGGLIGENTGTVTSSFWDTGSSGQSSSDGGSGEQSIIMISLFIYENAGWDFMNESANGTSDSWGINTAQNNGYPFLAWQGYGYDFMPGNGSSTTPFEISTLQELIYVSEHSDIWNRHFIQTQDIDASRTTNLNNQAGFSPLGNSTLPFSGSYSGQDHTLANLFINRPAQDQIGLFGYNTGTIKNLDLDQIDITGQNYVGGVIGKNTGSCNSVRISGTVSASGFAGLLVGENGGGSGTIMASSSTGTLASSGANAGGLVGWSNGTIRQSYADTEVSAPSYAGGLAGYSNGSIMNCFARGAVSGTVELVGGLIGRNQASVDDCYSTGSVSGSAPNKGGLVGDNLGTVSNSFWDTITSGIITSDGGIGKTTAEMTNYSTFFDQGWDFMDESENGTADVWGIHTTDHDGYPFLHFQGYENNVLQGSGTDQDPYQIITLNDLKFLSKKSFLWNSYFIQTQDIDASETSAWNNGEGFSPIGSQTAPFSGHYNGQGFTITALTIDRPSLDYTGLFGKNSGSILQLNIKNIDISGQHYVGGLAGQNIGSISSVNVSGTVSGASSVGILVGNNSGGSIVNSTSSGSLNATSGNAGGLAGWNNGTISRCYSTGNVTSETYVGGLIGYSEGDVNNCYATGSVSGTQQYVGGLVGRNQNQITFCYSIGSVSGGGSGVGGLIGDTTSPVNNCFWNVETSGKTTSSGGTGKTSAELREVATFTLVSTEGLTTAWDFIKNPNDDTENNNYWDMDQLQTVNNGYPILTWQNGADQTLPVELVFFNAQSSDRAVKLTWITESEKDNVGFILERSTDKNTWTIIASYMTDVALRGQGTVSYRTEYEFLDDRVEPGKEYYYRLSDINVDGEKTTHAPLYIKVAAQPKKTMLYKAYPNPFNASTLVSYQLADEMDVRISVFDILGRLVKELHNGEQPAGTYQFYWNGTDNVGKSVSSNIYIIHMQTTDLNQTQKVLYIK